MFESFAPLCVCKCVCACAPLSYVCLCACGVFALFPYVYLASFFIQAICVSPLCDSHSHTHTYIGSSQSQHTIGAHSLTIDVMALTWPFPKEVRGMHHYT